MPCRSESDEKLPNEVMFGDNIRDKLALITMAWRIDRRKGINCERGVGNMDMADTQIYLLPVKKILMALAPVLAIGSGALIYYRTGAGGNEALNGAELIPQRAANGMVMPTPARRKTEHGAVELLRDCYNHEDMLICQDEDDEASHHTIDASNSGADPVLFFSAAYMENCNCALSRGVVNLECDPQLEPDPAEKQKDPIGQRTIRERELVRFIRSLDALLSEESRTRNMKIRERMRKLREELAEILDGVKKSEGGETEAGADKHAQAISSISSLLQRGREMLAEKDSANNKEKKIQVQKEDASTDTYGLQDRTCEEMGPPSIEELVAIERYANRSLENLQKSEALIQMLSQITRDLGKKGEPQGETQDQPPRGVTEKEVVDGILSLFRKVLRKKEEDQGGDGPSSLINTLESIRPDLIAQDEIKFLNEKKLTLVFKECGMHYPDAFFHALKELDVYEPIVQIICEICKPFADEGARGGIEETVNGMALEHLLREKIRWKREIELLMGRALELEGELREKEIAISELRKKVQVMEEEHLGDKEGGRMRKLVEEISDLAGVNDELKRRIAVMEGEKRKLEAVVREKRKEVSDMQVHVAQLDERISAEEQRRKDPGHVEREYRLSSMAEELLGILGYPEKKECGSSVDEDPVEKLTSLREEIKKRVEEVEGVSRELDSEIERKQRELDEAEQRVLAALLVLEFLQTVPATPFLFATLPQGMKLHERFARQAQLGALGFRGMLNDVYNFEVETIRMSLLGGETSGSKKGKGKKILTADRIIQDIEGSPNGLSNLGRFFELVLERPKLHTLGMDPISQKDETLSVKKLDAPSEKKKFVSECMMCQGYIANLARVAEAMIAHKEFFLSEYIHGSSRSSEEVHETSRDTKNPFDGLSPSATANLLAMCPFDTQWPPSGSRKLTNKKKLYFARGVSRGIVNTKVRLNLLWYLSRCIAAQRIEKEGFNIRDDGHISHMKDRLIGILDRVGIEAEALNFVPVKISSMFVVSEGKAKDVQQKPRYIDNDFLTIHKWDLLINNAYEAIADAELIKAEHSRLTLRKRITLIKRQRLDRGGSFPLDAVLLFHDLKSAVRRYALLKDMHKIAALREANLFTIRENTSLFPEASKVAIHVHNVELRLDKEIEGMKRRFGVMAKEAFEEIIDLKERLRKRIGGPPVEVRFLEPKIGASFRKNILIGEYFRDKTGTYDLLGTLELEKNSSVSKVEKGPSPTLIEEQMYRRKPIERRYREEDVQEIMKEDVVGLLREIERRFEDLFKAEDESIPGVSEPQAKANLYPERGLVYEISSEFMNIMETQWTEEIRILDKSLADTWAR